MENELRISSTRSMDSYSKRVVYHLQTFPELYQGSNPYPLKVMTRPLQFSDGEMEVVLENTIRGKNVFLFGSTARNPFKIAIGEAKMELYHTVDVLRRSQPKKLIFFEPYCTCSRSDRATQRNSVGFWIHYKTLFSLGVEHIITYELHSQQLKTIVDPHYCAIEDIPASMLVMEYIAEHFVQTKSYHEEIVKRNWVFCSVDAGSAPLNRRFARSFGTSMIVAHKERNYQETNTINEVSILSSGSLKGKTIWIVDDMIDTAGSVCQLVNRLHEQNVAEINIAAVHPIFSDPASERLGDLHAKGLITAVVVLDTIDCDAELKAKMPFLQIVDSARLSAEIVMCLHTQGSMSPFFQDLNVERFIRELSYRA